MNVHELYESVLDSRLCLDPKRVARGFSLTYRDMRVTVQVDPDDLGLVQVDACFGDPGIAITDLCGVVNRISRSCTGVAACLDDGCKVCLRAASLVCPHGTAPTAEVLAAVLARMLMSLRFAAGVLGEGVTLARLDPDSATAAAAERFEGSADEHDA